MWMFFITVYILSVLLTSLNSIMVYINTKRKNNNFDVPITVLVTLVSLVPLVNTMVILLLTAIMSREIFLLSYLKGINNRMKCSRCKIVTRRHYLKDFEPEKDYLDEYKFGHDYKCPYCESSYSVDKTEKHNKNTLPFGKRINWLSAIVKYFTMGLNEGERKLKSLEERQLDLEFMDSQMAIWKTIQEKKLQEIERKMKETKKESFQ